MIDQTTRWRILVDPDAGELGNAIPGWVHEDDVEYLLKGSRFHDRTLHRDEPRPILERRPHYLFGVLAVPFIEEIEGALDVVYTQEIGVLLAEDLALLVVKTPRGSDEAEYRPYDCSALLRACGDGGSPLALLHNLLDDVADTYLHVFDALAADIDELEVRIDESANQAIRSDLRALRMVLLQIRRTLGPTREAVHGLLMGKGDVPGATSAEVQQDVQLRGAYDKLLRASEGLDFCRELLSNLRDFHQSKMEASQNQVMQRLTVVAALLLVPTFIAGVLGENLRGMPGAEGHPGNAFWLSIVMIAVIMGLELLYFSRKGWLGEGS